ncbi:ubiquinol-cytochrome c reductase iron-sulfur subunit N-terminal domain-containing protein [Tropicimonas sp. TH_r6]|uniref:ubiquinol-cytochrome c reductase iron-sulfur subunit N-terminal domain-containing protein n=1 Tax=Tropicimonas sp. TH_r6 TaxID=3082085 RepID=UPI002953D552|nr:ubiquinol-cytochrome c reductase iron-sulfur subunit N-terminal domain-containing protein [Tropicimonas sp. TH_r6]MDV7144902.1 ubiquinol-cytochrome c reductase iron-sulfur subunit N-terminal domain-containing protein [Tropicimonas sp. TH_r6]
MSQQSKDATRRDFLKVAAVSVPAAAAATIVPQEAAADEVTGDTRMQDTAHTRAYYDSARF